MQTSSTYTHSGNMVRYTVCMSQKTVIEQVKVSGASPYLGLSSDGEPMHSKNAGKVMDWLCDGWRTRFNQLRSTRKKYNKNHELVPLGGSVTDITSSQARKDCSWLAAIPSLVLESPTKIESTEWYANTKRRKTMLREHRPPGRMPRFKSRKRDDQYFVCWHNNGRNATFRQVNRKHGIVTITGQNPVGHRVDGVRWKIEIHIRVSQPIRDYTSVNVNWTRRTLVFANPPLPVSRAERTDKAIGVDVGCVHAVATSDGDLYDLPKAKLNRIEQEIRRRQKAQARKRKLAGYPNPRDYRKHGASKAYERATEQIRRLHAKAGRIREDMMHKISTELVRHNQTVIVERLNVQSMMRRARPKPDPNKPGQHLPNGQAAKRGLNRSIAHAGMRRLRQMLAYKCKTTPDRVLVEVNPAYTSQTCNHCGNVAKENRESQAVFHCHNCGYETNADLNAAKNILERGITHIRSMDDAPLARTMSDTRTPTRGDDAMVASKPQHSI